MREHLHHRRVQESLVDLLGRASGNEAFEQWVESLRRQCIYGMESRPQGDVRDRMVNEDNDLVEGGDPDAVINMQHVDTAGEQKLPWVLQVARMVKSVNTNMQAKLLQKSLAQYFCEWCDTPLCKSPGLATLDGCWSLMNDSSQIVPCAPAPDNNIYVFLDGRLTDPMEEVDTQRLLQFLESTFWSNEAGLQCMFAAMSLALHGSTGLFGVSVLEASARALHHISLRQLSVGTTLGSI